MKCVPLILVALMVSAMTQDDGCGASDCESCTDEATCVAATCAYTATDGTCTPSPSPPTPSPTTPKPTPQPASSYSSGSSTYSSAASSGDAGGSNSVSLDETDWTKVYPACKQEKCGGDNPSEADKKKVALCGEMLSPSGPKAFMFQKTFVQMSSGSLVKERHVRMWRPCKSSNQQKVDFVTSINAPRICEDVSCNDIDAMLKYADNSGSDLNPNNTSAVHTFADGNDPPTMLAIDLRLEKKMAVKECSESDCNTQKSAGNGTLSWWDCTKCSGNEPSSESPSGCQCFRYSVSKVCELVGSNVRNGGSGFSHLKIDNGIMGANAGLRGECALL